MGVKYGIKCAECDYKATITQGIGMLFRPDIVFYGDDGDPARYRDPGFIDSDYKRGDPLLLSIIDSREIREKSFGMLADGAEPDEDYSYELYICPACMRLTSKFYFKLTSPTEQYEPDHRCVNCGTRLDRAELEDREDGRMEVINPDRSKIDWHCPECGGDCLISSGYEMMWD